MKTRLSTGFKPLGDVVASAEAADTPLPAPAMKNDGMDEEL